MSKTKQHNPNTAAGQEPHCTVTALPNIGERRRYHSIVQPFAAHSHDHYVVGLVEEGHRQLVCNGSTVELAPGDMIVLNPGEVHACTQSDDGWFTYDSITIEKALFGNLQLKSPKIEQREVIEMLREILDLVSSINPANPLERAHLLEKITALFDLLAHEETDTRIPSKHDQAAKRVFARFCGNLAETPHLEELAAGEGISPYALIRAYRKRFSITPMQHLTSLRIECATKLLAEGIEVSCVAAETGFADQAHFTRAFKQRLGTTPAAYQKMMAASQGANT